MRTRAAGLAVLLLIAACSPPTILPADGGAEQDGGGASDAGTDAGGNPGADGGTSDGGSVDGGNPDGGNADGGNADGGGTSDGGTGDGGKPDGGGPYDGGAVVCFEDLDCPDPLLFFCNTATALCAPSCRNKPDCTAAVRGPYALPSCDNNPLGCQCDEGSCLPAFCTADSECGTQVCRNGACVAPPAASTITRCEVSPAFAVMAAGSTLPFTVVAMDSAGNPVLPATGATWATLAPLTASAPPAFTKDVAAANVTAATGPSDAVTAAFGTVTCKAKVIVHRIAAATIDVIVVDELTGRPVASASVLLTDPSTGAAIGGAITTDALGLAQAIVPGGTVSVSVSIFHADYDYLTIAGYNVPAGSRTLVAPVRRNPLDRIGGFKGTFTGLPITSNVHLGSAGVSQPTFFEPRLLAPPILTQVVIGSAINQVEPLAAASTMAFGANAIKNGYMVPALNGTCHAANGLVDEAATASGACGGGTAFGMTVDVPLGDVPIDAFIGGFENIDWAKVLMRVAPLYRKFHSTVRRDVEFTRGPTAVAGDGGWVLDDTTNHAVADLPYFQMPFAQSFVVRSADLPVFRGKFASIVSVRGVAHVKARGLVELGLGSGVNTTPADLKTDAQGTLGPGLIGVRMAPAHHGLETSPYAIVATASGNTFGQGAFEGSTVVVRLNALAWDPAGAVPVVLPPYLGFPDGVRYNFTDAAQGALAPRSLRFAQVGTVGGSVGKVTFTDRLGRRWVVLFSPSASQVSTALPKPTAALADRTFHEGVGTGTRSGMRVEATSFGTPQPIGFQQWMELGSGNPYRTLEFSLAHAFIDVGRPTVAWLQPANSGATVVKGSSVTLKVSRFAVGAAADGAVRVTFVNGNNCPASDGVFDPAMGKGEIPVVVPVTCTGANVQMTATLIDPAGVPLAPTVASPTLTVTVL